MPGNAEELAAANFDHADLGDQVAPTVAARGFDVEHAEGDIGQRCSEVVERALHGR